MIVCYCSTELLWLLTNGFMPSRMPMPSWILRNADLYNYTLVSMSIFESIIIYRKHMWAYPSVIQVCVVSNSAPLHFRMYFLNAYSCLSFSDILSFHMEGCTNGGASTEHAAFCWSSPRSNNCTWYKADYHGNLQYLSSCKFCCVRFIIWELVVIVWFVHFKATELRLLVGILQPERSRGSQTTLY